MLSPQAPSIYHAIRMYLVDIAIVGSLGAMSADLMGRAVVVFIRAVVVGVVDMLSVVVAIR